MPGAADLLDDHLDADDQPWVDHNLFCRPELGRFCGWPCEAEWRRLHHEDQ